MTMDDNNSSKSRQNSAFKINLYLCVSKNHVGSDKWKEESRIWILIRFLVTYLAMSFNLFAFLVISNSNKGTSGML
jgi:hypothetical protein